MNPSEVERCPRYGQKQANQAVEKKIEQVHDVVSSTKRRITVTAILPVAFLCHLSFALYLPADQVLASEPNKY